MLLMLTHLHIYCAVGRLRECRIHNGRALDACQRRLQGVERRSAEGRTGQRPVLLEGGFESAQG